MLELLTAHQQVATASSALAAGDDVVNAGSRRSLQDSGLSGLWLGAEMGRNALHPCTSRSVAFAELSPWKPLWRCHLQAVCHRFRWIHKQPRVPLKREGKADMEGSVCKWFCGLLA